MKISALNGGYKSVNFGRAMASKDEMTQAYNAELAAREAMGFKEGKGVLLLPSDKLPKDAGEAGMKEIISDFFENMKKLLGINTVEVSGPVSESVEETVSQVLDEKGIKRIAGFEFRDEGIEEAAQELAKNYDGLRIKDAHRYSDEQLSAIEEAFKKVKGDSFDPKMLIYEVNDDGALFDWNASKIQGRFDGKVVVGSSNYLNDNGGDLWGSTSFFTDRMHTSQGNFIHGVRKTGQPTLAQQIVDPGQVDQSIHLLEEELKLQDEDILNHARYAAAKRADVALSQNFYKHYDDIIPNLSTDVAGFSKAYFEALEKGEADNYFDSLAKALKARGLNEGDNGQIYEEVCKFRNALFAPVPEAVKGGAELTAEQIEASYKDTSNIILQGVQAKKDIIAREAAEQAEIKAREAAEKARKDQLSKMLDELNPLDQKWLDRLMNFARKHKKQFIFAGLLAAIAAVGGTMYSYGREIAVKSGNAKPKTENLTKKA